MILAVSDSAGMNIIFPLLSGSEIISHGRSGKTT